MAKNILPQNGFSLSASTLKRNAGAKDRVAASSRERREGIENTVLPLEGDELIEEIEKLWSEVQNKFLTIGRYLNRAFQIYEGNFNEMIVSRLSFGRIVAYQLRTVAAAVDSNKLPEDCLPRSYATAYKLITLSPSDYVLAKKANLLRPDITRPEVERFRKEMIRKRRMELGQSQALRDEQATLNDEILKMRQKIREAELRLIDITEQLMQADVEQNLVGQSQAS